MQTMYWGGARDIPWRQVQKARLAGEKAACVVAWLPLRSQAVLGELCHWRGSQRPARLRPGAWALVSPYQPAVAPTVQEMLLP